MNVARLWLASVLSLLATLAPGLVFAQPDVRGARDPKGMMGGGMCSMQGGGMWFGMVLGGVLALSAIAALIALTVFLIRRSRPMGPNATRGA